MDAQSTQIIATAFAWVETYMSQAHYDPSHDFSHIQRVVSLAQHIFHAEAALPPNPSTEARPVPPTPSSEDRPPPNTAAQLPRPSELIVTLGALLHDINDRKYLTPTNPHIDLAPLLQTWGVEPPTALIISRLCDGVSYSTERKDPDLVRALISEIPELAIVQDADRLDAIGAVGIGRCFTYGGARGRELEDSVGHFREKLVGVEGLMKTGVGREVARERGRRLRMFLGWWEEETGLNSGGS